MVGGVFVDLTNGEPRPATFNRTVVAADPEVRQALLLGPALIRKPAKLKKMIADTEDRGYAKSGRTLG